MEHLKGALQHLLQMLGVHRCWEDLLRHVGLLLSSRQCSLKAEWKTGRMGEIILRDSDLLQGGSCWRLACDREISFYFHSFFLSGFQSSILKGELGFSLQQSLGHEHEKELGYPFVICSLHAGLWFCWGLSVFLLLYSQLLVLQSVSLLPVSWPASSSHYLTLDESLH